MLNQPPEGIEFYAEGATFYAYNAEGVRDCGWGCAWRAIQTCLSSYDIMVPPFADLFHLFGPPQNLRRVYQDKYPSENLPTSEEFAPYQLSSGWTEPFIGEMAMHFTGVPADLESVNAIPGCNAPESVFHNPPYDFLYF